MKITYQMKAGEHLFFESSSVIVSGLNRPSNPFHFREFIASERISSEKEASASRYAVRFCSTVNTIHELNQRWEAFKRIKESIDSTWQYVFGYPYGGGGKSTSSRNEYSGWTNNQGNVLAKLTEEPPLPVLETQSYTVLEISRSPLRCILRAIDCYLNEDATFRFLTDLHTLCLTTENERIRLTLFGKLADLCETLLPGDSRKQKIDNLPPLFKERLVFDHKIFVFANTFQETRHAAKKPAKILHPEMHDGQKEDFQSDVDTLVRYLVFEKMKLPPCFYEGWRFPGGFAYRHNLKIGKQRSVERERKRGQGS